MKSPRQELGLSDYRKEFSDATGIDWADYHTLFVSWLERELDRTREEVERRREQLREAHDAGFVSGRRQGQVDEEGAWEIDEDESFKDFIRTMQSLAPKGKESLPPP
jgi:hypothetical protein